MNNESESFEHQSGKMISSYGGVGSLIDHGNFSFLVRVLEEPETLKSKINDERLFKKLRYEFRNLESIVKVPEYISTSRGKSLTKVKAIYFPEWLYCPRCYRFKPAKTWLLENDKLQPKCSSRECKNQLLEQIPYVLTCPNGHLRDLPWEHWNILNELSIDKSKKIFTLNRHYRFCCSNQDLRIETKDIMNNSQTKIKCINCKEENRLEGLFEFKFICDGRKPWIDDENFENCQNKTSGDEMMRVSIKSSNSIYYTHNFSSIYLPREDMDLDDDVKSRIRKLLKLDKAQEEILSSVLADYSDELDSIKDRGYDPLQLITKYIYSLTSDELQTKSKYRKEEFDFFMNRNQYPHDSFKGKRELVFSAVNFPNQSNLHISKMLRIDKVKQSVVQDFFTRQEPLDPDYPLGKVLKQYTFKQGKDTKYLMGIETYGEGLFISIDESKLGAWEKNHKIRERALKIFERIKKSDSRYIKSKESTIGESYIARFILVHTFSHLIIKELEYVCGYSSASLKERLYIGENMAGLLITAIEGSEGSLGGLVSLCDNPQKIQGLLIDSISRVKESYCSSDPICYNTSISEGQGVEGLNLAACYSCTLLPETSCEEFNLFLDRRLLIDKEIGFFRNYV